MSFINNMKDMYRYKRIAMHLGVFVALFALCFGQAVFAAPADSNIGGDNKIFTNPIQATSIQEFLKSLLQVVTTIGAVVVVFFIILAGFNYVTARGDEKKIQAATKTFTWTAVGAAVILGAQVIATAIQGTVNQLK